MDRFHPLAVHLPIATILLWPFLELIAWRTQNVGLARTSWGLLVVALATSIFATVTGQAAFDVALDQGVEGALLRTHTGWADYVPWALLALIAARAWLPQKLGSTGRGLVVALGFGFWPLIFTVGQTGGALVYDHGVGVRAPSVDGKPAKR